MVNAKIAPASPLPHTAPYPLTTAFDRNAGVPARRRSQGSCENAPFILAEVPSYQPSLSDAFALPYPLTTDPSPPVNLRNLQTVTITPKCQLGQPRAHG
jgi:hypothetical protein